MKKNKIIPALLIFFAVVSSYLNTLNSGFVYDDADVIVNNPFIKDWSKLNNMLGSGFWAHTNNTIGFFRPLTTFTYLIEYSIGGINPFIYHLDNLLLHFFVSLLVYLILERMLADRWAALVAALVFAVHPVHTEAVAWVSCRGDLLAAFFIFLALWLFIARPAGKASGILSSAAFFMGLLSKENAAIFPVLLAVYVVLNEGMKPDFKSARSLMRKISPYLIILFVYIGTRSIVLKGFSLPGRGGTFMTEPRSYAAFLQMCEAFTHYIRLAFFPFSLSAFYDFPPPSSIFQLKALFSILCIVLLLIFSVKLATCCKNYLFSAAFFFISLLPVSNIIPIDMLMAERALYVATFSVSLLLGAALSTTAAGKYEKKFSWRGAAYSVSFIIIIIFAAQTVSRNAVWKNELAFWTSLVERKPYSDHVHCGLGSVLLEQGRTDEAIFHFETAVGLNERHPRNHELLSWGYSEKGEYLKAVSEAKIAIALDGQVSARVKLGVAYGKMGMLDEAIREFETAQKLNPYVQDLHGNLGVASGLKGMTDKAIEEFKIALRLNPEDQVAKENLEAAYRTKEEEMKAKGK